MRILVLNDYASGGGAEVVVDDEARLLREAGHVVRVLSGEDCGGPPGPIGYVHNRRACRAVRRAIADLDPDVVHAHNVYHVLSPAVLGTVAAIRDASEAAGRGRRPRLVMTAHDFHLVCPNSGCCSFPRGGRRIEDPADWHRWSPAMALRAMRTRWDHRSAWRSWAKLLQHAWSHRVRRLRTAPDVIACPGAAAAARLRAGGVEAVVLPNPFVPAGDRPSAPPAARSARLVFAGRVEPEKGLVELLRIWPANRGLDVYGDGSARAEAEAEAQRRGIADRVRFHGAVPRAAVVDAVAASAALVMASRSPESAPVVLLEALATGTPVVVPDLGGMAEAVAETGAGRTFTPDDAASLARAVAEATAMRVDRDDPRVADALRRRDESSHLAGLLALYRGH